MAQSKHEYFHKGVDNQKTPDIIINLKRPSEEQMSKWDVSEREYLGRFIEDCKRSFEAFIKVLTDFK